MSRFFHIVLFALLAAHARAISFTNDVAPILVQKCLICHGAEKSKGGYRLDTFEVLLKAGSSKEGPLSPGKSENSQFYRLLVTTDEDDRMPQKNEPLSKAEIQRIREWIEGGSKFDGTDATAALVSLIPPIHQPEPPSAYPAPVPVTALAFAPDGSEISVSGYHEITVWSPEDGRLLRRVKNVAQSTLSLAYQPKGNLLAAASGTPGKLGEIKLFDAISGQLVRVLVTSADVMLAIAFNPDGTKLATGGSDNKIHIFEVASGKLERTIDQHSDWVTGLAFSHNGKWLASASRDKSARVCDPTTGEVEQSSLGHGDFVFSVGFTVDDKQVWSCGRDRKIQRWRPTEEKKEGEISGFEGDILRLLMTCNSVFSCSTDGLVREHSLGKEPELLSVFGKEGVAVYAIALDEAHFRLAAGAFDGTVRIWNTKSGRELLKFMAAPGFRN
ncbi:MAG: hypothetical protein JWM16_4519 [Verrucomicrobiales bacterium]|nr:hypothetical protein [Verrucomicrobiales bacterium]